MEPSKYRPSESDRRPLASRRWGLSIVLAGWLARRGVRANAVSMAGTMAKQHRMFVVTLTALAGAAVPVAWQSRLSGSGWGLPTIALSVISVGCVITVLRRLERGARALLASTP
jgi:hypothetical protein